MPEPYSACELLVNGAGYSRVTWQRQGGGGLPLLGRRPGEVRGQALAACESQSFTLRGLDPRILSGPTKKTPGSSPGEVNFREISPYFLLSRFSVHNCQKPQPRTRPATSASSAKAMAPLLMGPAFPAG